MIPKRVYEEAIFQAIHKGSTCIAPDVCAAFERAIEAESRPAAREGLSKTYQSIRQSAVRDNPACPDTGWPIFYFKVGNECELEGGFMALEEATRNAVRRATKEGYLRATIVRPLPSGNMGERDVYGAQQHAPVVNFAFEL